MNSWAYVLTTLGIAVVLTVCVRYRMQQVNKPILATDPLPSNKILYLILFAASFLLVPSIIYWQHSLPKAKGVIITTGIGVGAATLADKLKLFDLAFFKTLFSSVITMAVLGAIIWGALFFIRFEPNFWYHLINDKQ